MVVKDLVDKINGNSSYDFPGSQKRKNPAVKAYENTPGSKDAAGKRAGGVSGKNGANAFERKDSGVILDLSGKSVGRRKAHAAVRKKDGSWKDALRKLVAPVVQWLKDFWNSDASGEGQAGPSVHETEETGSAGQPADDLESIQTNGIQESAQPGDVLESDGMQESMRLDDDLESMQQLKALADRAVKSGDLRQIEQFLTQNGTKRLAHNSDLLTYYDRRGKFVEMDETEKHRVLFGDKNVLKL